MGWLCFSCQHKVVTAKADLSNKLSTAKARQAMKQSTPHKEVNRSGTSCHKLLRRDQQQRLGRHDNNSNTHNVTLDRTTKRTSAPQTVLAVLTVLCTPSSQSPVRLYNPHHVCLNE